MFGPIHDGHGVVGRLGMGNPVADAAVSRLRLLERFHQRRRGGRGTESLRGRPLRAAAFAHRAVPGRAARGAMGCELRGRGTRRWIHRTVGIDRPLPQPDRQCRAGRALPLRRPHGAAGVPVQPDTLKPVLRDPRLHQHALLHDETARHGVLARSRSSRADQRPPQGQARVLARQAAIDLGLRRSVLPGASGCKPRIRRRERRQPVSHRHRPPVEPLQLRNGALRHGLPARRVRRVVRRSAATTRGFCRRYWTRSRPVPIRCPDTMSGCEGVVGMEAYPSAPAAAGPVPS